MEERHEQWMAKYGKVYRNAPEKEMRLQIFTDDVEFVDAFNAGGDKPYKLSANAFADMTNSEFKTSRTGKLLGFFSIVAATEGINQLKTGELGHVCLCFRSKIVPGNINRKKLFLFRGTIFYQKDAFGCDVNGEDQGCEGGLMEDGFQFIINNGGLATEANYPYDGTDGTCKTTKEASHAAKITDYEVVPANDEATLLKAVANRPGSASIDAGGRNFQFHSTGILTGDCGTYLGHGVTAAGYGNTADGT
ncbi:hypothetical protein EUGRSUZ_A01901 [Eucalyptus grandis]|uniref:Uncharacterized protein n=2 Tax=Eucalyptus grandis TaxID=71139 RepID=A0ACC3M4B4_EUCGR|nr:hypothetical protein EUGRSUZ_A01901 [Eucalyptus grandis]